MYCGAAGMHDSDSGLDFARRIFMSRLPVTDHGVDSNQERENLKAVKG